MAASIRDDVLIDDLVKVRFPVIYYGGAEFTIPSVAEDLRTDRVLPRATPTVESVSSAI